MISTNYNVISVGLPELTIAEAYATDKKLVIVFSTMEFALAFVAYLATRCWIKCICQILAPLIVNEPFDSTVRLPPSPSTRPLISRFWLSVQYFFCAAIFSAMASSCSSCPMRPCKEVAHACNFTTGPGQRHPVLNLGGHLRRVGLPAGRYPGIPERRKSVKAKPSPIGDGSFFIPFSAASNSPVRTGRSGRPGSGWPTRCPPEP